MLDCGLFHTFDGDERPRYVASLASVTEHDETLYVLCFSDEGPDKDPHPISQDELKAAFNPTTGWSVAAIEPDRLQTRYHDDGAPAWFATIKRIQDLQIFEASLAAGLTCPAMTEPLRMADAQAHAPFIYEVARPVYVAQFGRRNGTREGTCPRNGAGTASSGAARNRGIRVDHACKARSIKILRSGAASVASAEIRRPNRTSPIQEDDPLLPRSLCRSQSYE